MSKEICSQCGDCCDPVVSGWTKKQVKEIKGFVPSREFILHHWRRINREEAVRRRPALKRMSRGAYFYECDLLDPVTRLCKDYENRPPICSRFPMYGRKGTEETALWDLPNCPYRKKVKHD